MYKSTQPSENSNLMYQERKDWYKPQTTRENYCCLSAAICGVLALIFLICVIVLAVKVNKKSEVVNSEDLCLTPQCLTSAATLLNSMNNSVDPCEDFYLYSCGKWIEEHKINELPSESQFFNLQDEIYMTLRDILDNSMVKNASQFIKSSVNFYRSCLNSKNSDIKDNFLQMMNEIGGWPLTNDSWQPSEYVYKYIANAISILKIEPLFKVDVKPDDKNTTVNIISISQPARINISDVIKFLESLKINSTDHENDIENMKKLDQIIKEASENNSTSEKLTILELMNKTNFSDWLNIIHLIMKDNWVHLNITEYDVVQVDNINYFINLYQKLKENNIDERIIANYIGSYAALIFFTKIGIYQISPLKEVQPWKPCLILSLQNMPLAMDHLYVSNKNISEAYADEMIKYLRTAFKHLAAKANWLDDATRHEAYDKLEAMIQFSGYNPMILNITSLEKYYEHLDALTDEDIILNLRKVAKFIIAKQFSLLREYNHRTSWITDFSATLVNAFYNPLQNSITFFAAIQNLPFYDVNRPWYMNFGAIGSVIGHEITHGFDNQGSQRDKNGNLYDWWSSETKAKFLEKTQCFIDQYNKYKIPEINENINGTRTLGENIADNGGLRQAFQAYQYWEQKYGKEKLLPGLEKFDSKKLFFLSFANTWCAVYSTEGLQTQNRNEHSLPKYRVIGTLSNMEEFSAAFNCKKGSRMNPENKCIIW
ncbi:neprilysin-1-like isoform X2 [Centruroides vittatus]|uniref:neprilysin-1-like isoform X2 n=1 Tax=Centruroides vittatus TaxID=120091 RepID=UPI00351021B3